MGSCAKRSRKPSEVDVDRLSPLSDIILHRILSNLDFLDVVKTCVLSKRWRHVWMSVPCLNFSAELFIKHNLNMSSYHKFWDFIKIVLILRNRSQIRRISVSAVDQNAYRAYQLNLLLCIADKLKVEELCFNGGDSDELFSRGENSSAHELDFPCVVCETLTMLTVEFHCKIPLRVAAVFSSLKNLHLRGAIISGDAAQKLFSSDCVKLENVHLEDCQFKDLEIISISACNLKILTIANVYCRDRFWAVSSCDSELNIIAPNLVSFCYIGPMLRNFSLLNTVSLKHASFRIIRIPQGQIYGDKLGYKDYIPCPTRFVGLNQAKTLTLSSLIVKYLSPTYRGHLEDTLMLDNLNCLKLGLRYNVDCIEGMMNLLKISPNLEALFISFKEKDLLKRSKRRPRWDYGLPPHQSEKAVISGGSWKPRLENIDCLLNHVKFIQIYNFDGSDIAIELVKFLRKKGKVLEKMEILYRSEENTHKGLKRVKATPKSSWKAVLSFTEYSQREDTLFESEDSDPEDY